MAEQALEAVRKSVTVGASPEEAFEIFTGDSDSWWPHTHHIGKAPMTKVIIEDRRVGRCYTEHEDGSEANCDMRAGVGGEGGWGGLLQLFAAHVEQKASEGES